MWTPRTRIPNLIAWAPPLPHEVVVVLVTSQRLVFVKLVPICEPPPLKALFTLIATPAVVPVVVRFEWSNWKHVSLTVVGLMIIESVNWIVCWVDSEFVARVG